MTDSEHEHSINRSDRSRANSDEDSDEEDDDQRSEAEIKRELRKSEVARAILGIARRRRAAATTGRCSTVRTATRNDSEDERMSIDPYFALNSDDEPLVSVDLGEENEQALHDEAAAFVEVYLGSAEILEAVMHSPAMPDEVGRRTAPALRLKLIHTVGQPVVESERYPDPFVSDGFDALPENLARLVCDEMRPAAPAFGVDREHFSEHGSEADRDGDRDRLQRFADAVRRRWGQ